MTARTEGIQITLCLIMSSISLVEYSCFYDSMLLASKGELLKCISISIRLPVNNHRSFFFHSTLLFFEIWRQLATHEDAWQPLPVYIVLHLRHSFACSMRIYYVFGIDVLSRMSSYLLCAHNLHFLWHILVTNV